MRLMCLVGAGSSCRDTPRGSISHGLAVMSTGEQQGCSSGQPVLEPSSRARACVGARRVVDVCDVETGLLVGSNGSQPSPSRLLRTLGLSFEADLTSRHSGRVPAVAKKTSEQTGPRAEDIGRLKAESWGLCVGGVVASVDSQG